MATSLAEQLRKLAVPQTSALKHDKKRASLLFDPKEAAGIKREVIYQIGLEGLEELIQKNAVFEQFEDSLFHITSKDFERSVQVKDANNKLDKNLKKFLLLLSPYFMLNCAHKALEWLINRYSIHEYNREDLLMLCLPYHESNIFVRVIQLLKFKDTRDSFHFLKSLQRTGAHLTKLSLLNHASTNSGFLKFVTKYLMDLLKCHEKPNLLTVVYNFYCTVFTGALEYSHSLNEDQVSQMLPLILKGLNSPIPDFCAASYVVTARLVSKTTLSSILLDKFMEKISEVQVPNLKTETTLIIIILYQSQKHYTVLPPVAVANLSEKEWLPKELQILSAAGSSVYPFLEILIRHLTQEGVNNDMKLSRDMVKGSLDQIKIDDHFVGNILLSILDVIRPKMKVAEDTQLWLTEIVQKLETQYPEAFDKEVYRILSATDKKSLHRKKTLMELLRNTVAYQGKFNLFEKLYHSNQMIRGDALKFLSENFDTLNETDREIILNSFNDRLRSDDINAVQETLAVLQRTPKISKSSFKEALINLAEKYHVDKEKWNTILNSVINILSEFKSSDWHIFIALMPFLLPDDGKDYKQAKKLIDSKFITDHIFFKSQLHKLKGVKDSVSLCKQVLKILGSNSDPQQFTIFQQSVVDKEASSVLRKYLVALLTVMLLPKNCTIEVETVINLLEAMQSSVNVFADEASVSKYIAAAGKGKFPVRGVLSLLEIVVAKTSKNQPNLNSSNLFQANERTVFVTLLNILMINDEKYEKLLETFLARFFDNFENKLEFLLNACISENPLLKDDFKYNTLLYLNKILKASDTVNELLHFEKPLISYLLVLLADTKESTRQQVFELIGLLAEKSTKKSGTYYHLLDNLKKYTEEILMDHEQVPLVLFNILDFSSTKGKKNVTDLNASRNNLFKIAGSAESPVYLRAGLLKLLSHINSFAILEETAKNALDILVNNTDTIKDFEAKTLGHVVSRIEANVLTKLSFESHTWNLIQTCIKNDRTVVFNDVEDKICPSPLMLNQLDKEIFTELPEEVEKKLLDIIIDIASIARNPEVPPAASKIFKHIDLDARLILDQLNAMRDVQSPKLDPSKNKRRISVVPTLDILDSLEWKKGVTILEFLQDKKKLRNIECLFQVLFELLQRCLNFDEQSAVEYPKQLLLSSILHCCTKTETALPENVFNVEVIVQCIRASQNPQTHHHALLVLAHTAHLIPTQVLHHMMAIFTFMGSSVLRHDDAYSFQIITKIIDTIIPILVSDNQDSNIAKVLRVFVDALLDVPEHRRTPLYKQLLERIDPKENLYIFLLLIFESQVMHSNNQDKQSKESWSRRLDIAAGLCREFSPQIVIETSIKLLNYLQSLPDEKEENMEVDGITTFDITTHTPKDFRHYKYILLKFTANLLGSTEFVNQTAALHEEEELSLEPLFKQMIVNILQYIQRISKVAEKAVNTPQSQYWKVALHLSYDILDCTNGLVTSKMFLLVTKGLMVHKLPTVRRRILELLNQKLQYNIQFFADCELQEIYTLIPPLITIIEGLDGEVEPDQEVIIQTTLLTLKLLVRALAQDDPEKFVQILEFVTKIIRSGKANSNVLASVVLCLAELCVQLKGHSISSLPEFMPGLIKILKQQKHEESSSLLLRSIVTAIEKIIDSLPLFLSPYLEKLLVELSVLSFKWGSNTDEQKLQPFVSKLGSIKQKIGKMIPLRVLLPAVEQSYNTLVSKGCSNATSALMALLGEALTNLKGSDLTSSMPELTSFFLSALKFRTDSECELEEANLVESHVVKAFTVLILKLSENSFRPLYYKIYDWAARSDVKSERLITFYNLSSDIAKSLKGLFVLFAGHIVNNSAQVLEACNKVKSEQLYYEDETKNALLLEKVLKTLDCVFLHDSQKFVNKDRFDILMQPLVDQLENDLGGLDSLVKRNDELVTPCLVNFAAATADDALWKQMNYQILLKMRHSSAQIRLSTLRCLTEMVKKLGEEFLPLLPETIPFLSELLEDEEEEVEKACQRAVQEMEKILGEPLQKYF